ncbi:hypothetical protein KR018_007241, partial [Drosophila ironensis]
MSNIELIVTPKILYFRANMSQSQMRLVSMMNATGCHVEYSIRSNNETDYQVENTEGIIEPYETVGVKVTILQVGENLPNGSMEILNRPKDMDKNWDIARVRFEVDTSDNPKPEEEMLEMNQQIENLERIIAEETKMLCEACQRNYYQ